MRIEEKNNGWYKIGEHGFAKKIGDNMFEIIRIEIYEDYVNLTIQEKVDLSNVDEDLLKIYGDFKKYLKAKDPLEKSFLASYSMLNDSIHGCEDKQEVKEFLFEKGVIDDNEILDFLFFN